MKLIRRIGQLRLLVMLLVGLVTVYVVSMLQSSQRLDDISMTSHQIKEHQRADDSMSLRNVKSNYQYDDNDLVYYKKDVPLIWVGGVPRSGTTLMRVMLDAHKDIRCGEETRVIPRLLYMHVSIAKSQREMQRLTEAKITEDVLNNALAAYILSIISQHGERAPRLCNKDPFALKSMDKILHIFPQSKFLLMIRDGRATVHSIISRHVTIKGFNIESYRGGLQDWNRAIQLMYNECLKVGPEVCLPIYYEQLVLHPRGEMMKILKFLDLSWDEMVLHHEQTINKTGGASLSGTELSTDQVEKPINTEALTNWVSYIPPDVRKDMNNIAPMLQVLGYDPYSYPPRYGEPDPMVRNADNNLKRDNSFHQERKPKVFPDGRGQPAPSRNIINGNNAYKRNFYYQRPRNGYNMVKKN